MPDKPEDDRLVILPHPIPCRRHGEDGILFQAKTRLTMDELMLYAAINIYGEQREREIGHWLGLEHIPDFIEYCLATWPVRHDGRADEVITRLRNADRQWLIRQITAYAEELDAILLLARSAEGST